MSRPREISPTKRAKLRQLKRQGEASRVQAARMGVNPGTACYLTQDISGPSFNRQFAPADKEELGID